MAKDGVELDVVGFVLEEMDVVVDGAFADAFGIGTPQFAAAGIDEGVDVVEPRGVLEAGVKDFVA